MKRQITIYESAQNGKLTVFNDVECNTLGELKNLLREKGINFSNMEFIEGVTNTKLVADDSRIPDHIPFKGKFTDNVFINILQKDAKIKSGVDYSELTRVELLHYAKPFAEELEDRYGENYTRIKSSVIVEFLEDMDYEDDEMDEKEYDNENEDMTLHESVASPHYAKCELTLENLAKAIKRIADVLEVNVDDLVCVKEESFFSIEDMTGFLRK